MYWASDCYATPVSVGVPTVADLDPAAWQEGFTMCQEWNSPWVSMVDPPMPDQAVLDMMLAHLPD